MDTLILSNFMFSKEIDIHSKIVYAGLKKFLNKDGICFPSRNTLVNVCKISLSTVRKAIKGLINAKILNKQERFRYNGSQTSNLYTLVPFVKEGEYYFKVRNDIFELELCESEIIVYMYLCCCANKDNECYPSIKQISVACSVCDGTVKRVIKSLVNKNMIEKSNQYRQDNGKRNNLYRIVMKDNQEVVKEEKADQEVEVEISIDKKEESSQMDINVLNLAVAEKSIDNYNDESIVKLDNEIFVRDDIFVSKLSNKELIVYLYLCSCYKANEKYFPSKGQIAKMCKLIVIEVVKAIAELKDKELLFVKGLGDVNSTWSIKTSHHSYDTTSTIVMEKHPITSTYNKPYI